MPYTQKLNHISLPLYYVSSESWLCKTEKEQNTAHKKSPQRTHTHTCAWSMGGDEPLATHKLCRHWDFFSGDLCEEATEVVAAHQFYGCVCVCACVCLFKCVSHCVWECNAKKSTHAQSHSWWWGGGNLWEVRSVTFRNWAKP